MATPLLSRSIHSNEVLALEFFLKLKEKKFTVVQPNSTLTKFIPYHGHFRCLWGLTHSCRVRAADAETVGFPLRQVEQSKAGGLHRELCVHPLPLLCFCVTLQPKQGDHSWHDKTEGNVRPGIWQSCLSTNKPLTCYCELNWRKWGWSICSP